MILVLLGTQNNSFKRLLEEIDQLIQEKVIQDKVVVQAGYTKYQSESMQLFDLISNEELEKLQNQADYIIAHGGVGSILSSIQKGKKVIAIPRLHKYAEHVNDHQKEIVQVFQEKGYVIGIQEVEELKEAIEKIDSFIPVSYLSNNEKLRKIVEDFIDQI